MLHGEARMKGGQGVGDHPVPPHSIHTLTFSLHLTHTHKHPTINLLKYLLPKHFNDGSSPDLEYITVLLLHSSRSSLPQPFTL